MVEDGRYEEMRINPLTFVLCSEFVFVAFNKAESKQAAV